MENPLVLDLTITPQDASGRISFSNLKAGEGAKKNEVAIEIKSNTGRQYQVIQNVLSELLDKEGRIIPAQSFSMHMEGGDDVKGTLRAKDNQQVKKGDTILFISDPRGASDKFKIIYELAIPKDLIAGDYSTRITYSLVEL